LDLISRAEETRASGAAEEEVAANDGEDKQLRPVKTQLLLLLLQASINLLRPRKTHWTWTVEQRQGFAVYVITPVLRLTHCY